MFLLTVIASALVPPPPRQAKAAVRIERAIPASRAWQAPAANQRRELIVLEQGRPVKVRLVEFE